MAFDYDFTDEETEIDETVGYPRAYARLCRDRSSGPYAHGPPFTFMPYCLHEHEVLRAMDLEQLFPIFDPKAKHTGKPKLFISLLWKQLSHLGNAGFDPAVIRVDPYGNVLYFHADSASPLAWDIDHWFPCSRGGLTVPSNLRILQWQACKKKHNKLEFLIPWWDFQLGISVNQFLSIFASSNSDFRHRAFSFLFSEGESEELNSSQTVESHSFPQHFVESKEKLGLAPAAIVASRRESFASSTSMALQSLDYNRLRPRSPALAARKSKTSSSKENENPDYYTNPYQSIVMARDSLKQREETSKMQAEIQKIDNEVSEMRRKNEEEKVNIQDLELVLIKRRRRAEKCRRLAEAQSSYRTMLEKMIRDAMHQNVIYKEQIRLNQAASTALTARLEAQKAITDASEKDLHRKYKERDDLEKQIRPEWEQARKRSRMNDDASIEDRHHKPILCLPEIKPRTPLHKELRIFLEEEQKASGLSLSEEEKQFRIGKKLKKSEKNFSIDKRGDRCKAIVVLEDDNITEPKFSASEENKYQMRFSTSQEPEVEEDEESRKKRGKGNVEKWLQLLLENAEEDLAEAQHLLENKRNKTDDDNIITKLNNKYPQIQEKIDQRKDVAAADDDDGVRSVVEGGAETSKASEERRRSQSVGKERKGKEKSYEHEDEVRSVVEGGGAGTSKASEERGRSQSVGKERKLVRSDSFRAFRRIPSSPSIILGMKKGVDCIGKKPMVSGDDEDYDVASSNGFLKSSIKSIKKAVKI